MYDHGLRNVVVLFDVRGVEQLPCARHGEDNCVWTTFCHLRVVCVRYFLDEITVSGRRANRERFSVVRSTCKNSTPWHHAERYSLLSCSRAKNQSTCEKTVCQQ